MGERNFYSEETREEARCLANDGWCVSEITERTGVSGFTLRTWKRRYSGWPKKWGIKGRRNRGRVEGRRNYSRVSNSGKRASSYIKEERDKYAKEAVKLKKAGLSYGEIAGTLGLTVSGTRLAEWCREIGHRERRYKYGGGYRDCDRCGKEVECWQSMRDKELCLCEKDIVVEEEGEKDNIEEELGETMEEAMEKEWAWEFESWGEEKMVLEEITWGM